MGSREQSDMCQLVRPQGGPRAECPHASRLTTVLACRRGLMSVHNRAGGCGADPQMGASEGGKRRALGATLDARLPGEGREGRLAHTCAQETQLQ